MRSIKSKFMAFLLAFVLMLSFIPVNNYGINVAKSATFADDLFISEYVEGSSNNKAIEIFNGTDHDVDLSGYKIELYPNGAQTAAKEIVLSGILKKGEVYVIANSSSAVDLKNKANFLDSNVTSFNGDDAIALSRTDGTKVDVFGKIGEDPGTSWGNGATVDHTLVRKSNITHGDINGSDDFDPSLEWDVYGKDDFSHLGSHVMDGFVGDTQNHKPQISNITYIPQNPSPGDQITVSANIYDADGDTITATLYYKNDTQADFSTSAMVYQDGKYIANINVGTMSTQFYVSASDGIDTSISEQQSVSINTGIMKIKDLKSLSDGSSASIQGVVTAKFGTANYYVQDDTSGILIYESGTDVAIGDELKLDGSLTTYNGEREFKPAKKELIKQSVQLPEPKVVTIDQVKDPIVQGMLVKIEDSRAVKLDGNGGFYIEDSNKNQIDIFNYSKNTFDINKIVIGNYYTIAGIASLYKTTYEIKPRGDFDIQEGTAPVDNQAPAITVLNEVVTAEEGSDITIQAVITDNITVLEAKLFYRQKGSTDFKESAMTKISDSYSAIIPGSYVTTEGIEYFITATDGTNESRYPTGNAYKEITVTQDLSAPKITNLTPADGSTIYNTKPVITAEYNDQSGIDTNKIVFKIDGIDLTSYAVITEDSLTYTPQNDMELKEHQISLTLTDKKGNSKEYTWSFTISAPGEFKHYAGTTHNHTEISHDATGTPEDALKAAIAHGYDWFAFSEHSHDIDSAFLGKDEVNAPGSTTLFERKGDHDWQLEHQLADQYTKDGSFVVFPSFEMTSTTWGHSNIFNTQNFIDRKQDGGIYQDLNKFYAWILTHPEAVAQFNHPGMPEGSFSGFVPYLPDVDKLFTIMEVGNGSGQYSYTNTDYLYYKALDIGWHVAPTFGEDNHNATWGQTSKRTILLAKDLTKDSLLDAMRNMRAYMVEDPNLRMEITVNGYPMGSTLPSDGKLSFHIKVWDNVEEGQDTDWVKNSNFHSNDNIKSIQIITNNGKIINEVNPETKDYTGDLVIDSKGHNWYIVKVTQEDGQRAYSAPFWTPYASVDLKLVGIGANPSETIIGTNVKLSAGVTNLGSSTVNNVVVDFYKNNPNDENNKIGEVTIPSIGSQQNATAEIDWAPQDKGTILIFAVIKNAPEGDNTSDNIVSTILKIDEPLGLTVMIDNAHNNDYESKGSLKSVQEQLRKAGYTVVENTAPFTSKSLKDVDVLIITQPIGSDKNLSDDEMNAVNDFIKCGKGLFYAGNGSHNNDPTISNILLNKLGTSININYDDIYESDAGYQYSGANSPWAVLASNIPKNMNMLNILSDRVKNIRYFSGASLVDKDGKDLTPDDGVEILVYANSTSYQYDGQGYMSDTTYKYLDPAKIPLVAVQNLSAGKIAVSGRAFFSDYEYGKGNGNELLTINIVNWLANRNINPTDIKDARKLPEGTFVTVQGTVTTGAGVFFDAFYLQDSTGGINAFKEVPDNADLKPGDIVRVYGYISSYENELELTFDKFDTDVVKLGHGDEVKPMQVSTKEAVSGDNQGKLVKVSGRLTGWYDNNSFYLDDGSGKVLVFVDGYIINQSGQLPVLNTGDNVSAVGLSGMFKDGARIRVRDTKEIVKISAPLPPQNTLPSPTPSNAQDNELGRVTESANIVTLSVDENKAIDKINNTSKDYIDIDLNSIGSAAGKSAEIPVSVFAKANEKGKGLIVKTEDVAIKLAPNSLDMSTAGQNKKIVVSIINMGNEGQADAFKAVSGTFNISIKVDNDNVKLNREVEVSIKTDGASDYRKLGVYYYNENSNKWEYVGGKVDKTNNVIAFKPEHFSKYAVFEYNKVFQDVKASHWANDVIGVIAAKHIIEGVDDNNYAPENKITRAEFAAMMIRMLGIKEQPYKGEFEDVKTGSWYANAIEAAYNAGIIFGDGVNMHPEKFITREEIAAISMRVYEKMSGYKEEKIDNTEFDDNNMISDWARRIVSNAAKTGIMSGKPGNLFAPVDFSTRAEAAAVIYRILNKTNNI